jgi:NAD-dependent deacetylase
MPDTPAHVAPQDMIDLTPLTDRLHRASRVTVLTGAGVSAASGIPTFRGAGGLWGGLSAEALASARGFAADPKLVWEWYDWRRQLIRDAEPNAAHHALAAWMRARPGLTLITQNVDGLHERAGARDVLRLHGSIWQLRCWHDCHASGDSWTDESVPLVPLPPRCPHCGALARPGVIWFGEPLDRRILAAAARACECDVFLSVGTSSVVYPAAGLLHDAKRHGAFTIEINPDATDASSIVDCRIRAAAEDVLPRLLL